MNMALMCLQGSAMIVVVLIVRALFLHRLPKTAFMALWVIVLVRLLVPISIPAPANVWSMIEDGLMNAGIEVAATLEEPVDAAAAPSGLSEASPSTGLRSDPASGGALPSADAAVREDAGAAPSPTGAAAPGWIGVVNFVWIGGCVAVGAFMLAGYLRHARCFAAAAPVTRGEAREWLAAHPLRRPLQIKETAVPSPLTVGVFRPVILVPYDFDWNDPARSALVLEHEFVHVARFDNALKVLLALAACTFWFNPLVWAMYACVNRDIELSCDERVARKLNGQGRSSYAHALIDAASRQTSVGPAFSAFGKSAIEERVTALAKVRFHTAKGLAATICLAVAMVAAFATTVPASWGLPLAQTGDGLAEINEKKIESTDPSLFYATYSIEGGIRLIAPHYTVDMPSSAFAGEPVFSYEPAGSEAVRSDARDVLTVSDSATGEVLWVVYTVHWDHASGAFLDSMMDSDGYACIHAGSSVGETTSGKMVVLGAPASETTTDDALRDGFSGGRFPTVRAEGLYAKVWGLPSVTDVDATLLKQADRRAFGTYAVAEENGTRIVTEDFSVLVPAAYPADELAVRYEEWEGADGKTRYRLSIALPDGRRFVAESAPDGAERSPDAVMVPMSASASQGDGTAVSVSSPSSDTGPADLQVFAGWVEAA